MTDVNDFHYTDGVHDVLAVYVNRLMDSTMRAEYKNNKTLSADYELLDADVLIQRVDCNGANRIAKLPAGSIDNHPFILVNVTSSGAWTLTVKSNDAATTYYVLAPGSSCLMLPNGNGGYLCIKPIVETDYKITPTVASNNLTLTLTHADGDTPSTSRPLWFLFGSTWRSITGALSVTKNAGTNWCNSGGSELATNEVDYFVYAGYNATDGVTLGFSRIPYARLYSDFSATSTNEKYCSISTITNAAAGDSYINIGRFAATLSAGAGYTWSVPTFTNANLVQFPIYSTRPLIFTPAFINLSNATLTGKYYLDNILCRWRGKAVLTGSSVVSGSVSLARLPFSELANVLLGNPVALGDSGTALYSGKLSAYSTLDAKEILVLTTGATYAGLSSLSSIIPFSWTINDAIEIEEGTYSLI